MIRSLEVKELNNKLSDKFEFHEDLNIFTGPNGSCKTTLLKLMWYLISGNFERILPEIPFQSISIKAELFFLSVTYMRAGMVRFVHQFAGEKEVSETIEIERARRVWEELNSRISKTVKRSLFFPTFRRIESVFSPSRHVNNPRRRFLHPSVGGLQHSMEQLLEDVSDYDHKFIASISTDDIAALVMQKHGDISGRADELQVKLSRDITQKIEDYFGGETGTEVQKPQDAIPVLENIRNRVEKVTQTRENLFKPFSVLADLAQEILGYQSIGLTERITHGEGTDGITLGEGTDGITLGVTKEAISSDKLSAGEKQMLSFLCYNAFSEDTVILIDEPELSLHVDWQRLLLPILLQQKTGNQFFVATHSPFIYARYPDKEIPIKKLTRQ